MEVLLKKDDRDEENADDDYSYVFTEAITCARAGIVWTRRGDDLDLGIQQDWNR